MERIIDILYIFSDTVRYVSISDIEVGILQNSNRTKKTQLILWTADDDDDDDDLLIQKARSCSHTRFTFFLLLLHKVVFVFSIVRRTKSSLGLSSSPSQLN